MLKNIKKHILRNSDILRKNKVQINYFLKSNQLVGGGDKVISIEYKNKTYRFEEAEIYNNYFILWSQEENPLECVSIIISKEDRNAEIHGISNYEKCIADTNTNVGSFLLKLTIKMLKRIKNKFNIDTITLTDNSLKSCGKNNIILSKMLILLTGNTWYGKYGFRPFNPTTLKLNKIQNDKYEDNIKIMNKMTIKKAKLLKYIKMTNDKNLIKIVERILELEPNMLLSAFLSNFLKNYDDNCKYFSMFYEKIYNDIGLYDLYKQFFGLTL